MPEQYSLWSDSPFSLADLERYRVRAHRNQRALMMGAHVQRRRGASLEFREFTPYIVGDDMRHIDWRASARNLARQFPGAVPTAHLLMRRFEAEEKFKLIISVDMRATMRLPEHLPKLQIAAWLAETLAWLGQRSEDVVMLHRLFGQSRNQSGLIQLMPRASWQNIRELLQKQCDEELTAETEELLNLRILERHLPPPAVWVVISDSYSAQESLLELGARITRARDGLRWVVPVDLDSWTYERSLLIPPKDRTRAFRIKGPMRQGVKQGKVDRGVLEQIERDIETHKQVFRKRAGLPHKNDPNNEVYWEWETQAEWEKRAANQKQSGLSPEQSFFQDRFKASRVLERLFMRDRL